MTTTTPIAWKGNQGFRLTASGLHEDTVRIVPAGSKTERILRLVLPTLCITYADMGFQNAVGGEQLSYPASRQYGPAFFDPPVEISGEADIERLTYIRGAQRVTIGPDETIVEFGAWRELVVPRLRLDPEDPAEALLDVPETTIHLEEPLAIQVMQFADGRHVGGVQLEKSHPAYRPPTTDPVYDLWVRVIDGLTTVPLPEAKVSVWHWYRRLAARGATGGFRLDDQLWTDGAGSAEALNRPSGDLEAVTVSIPGSLVIPRCTRPLAGQRVRLHMRAWPLVADAIPYTWRARDSLARMAELTGHAEGAILRLNRLYDAGDLTDGLRITLPCYAAAYRLESWDDPDWIAASFGYDDAATLAKLNRLRSLASYDPIAGLKLPDWRFFYAREGDTLDKLDEFFELPRGSCASVGRVYRPDPRRLLAGETVAVPTERHADRLSRIHRDRLA